MSDSVLSGGHGTWVEKRIKLPFVDFKTVIIETREDTLRRFKKSEITFKETLLGGCVKVGACDQVALNWLDTDCLTKGCKNMVCNPVKLERVIKTQENLVEGLDKETIEYRKQI